MVDLSTLNPPQREAASYLDGPALVLAGAGSGKTRVITHRIAWLIAQGVRPENILGVTFTNKAAREMRERVGHLLEPGAARKVNLHTFHALGAEILRHDIDRAGYRKPFSIVDDSDQFRVLKGVLAELNLGGTGANEGDMLALFSKAKNNYCTPAQLPEARFNPEVRRADRIFHLYNAQLRNLGAVDFDDLLLLPTRLLEEHSDLQTRYRLKYRYIMVDEYQDTNPLQLRMLQQLVGPPHYNLMVVGDDDQSIYAFRGAVSDYILRFEEFFPGTKVIALEQNYRSVGSILDAANAVISKNTVRRAKTLWSTLGSGKPVESIRFESDVTEADYIARRILGEAAHQNRPFHDFAILFRVNPQARVMEEALKHHRVPYRLVGGTSLFDRKEVRDVTAYLSLLVNPADELALRRIINYPTRGIGTTTQEQLNRRAHEENLSLAAVVEDVVQAKSVSGKAAEGLRSLHELLTRYRDRLRGTPPDGLVALLTDYIADIGIAAAIRAHETNANIARVRWSIVEETIRGAGRMEFGDTARKRLEDYVERISLDPASATDDPDEQKNRVTLMTLHSSKGLEFPIVFMIGMNEGGLPHSRALEEKNGIPEERRLCYVGMTRAREHLILTRPRTAIKRNERLALKPSRFLTEIPKHLLQSFVSKETEAEDRRQNEINAEGFAALRALLNGDESSKPFQKP
ncbi:MAG: UvrD-helicase domain-containing protein [Myxococcales bacterium]|nr:UvrD-helicase domain-containing protein [Myxococcales bacterium]